MKYRKAAVTPTPQVVAVQAISNNPTPRSPAVTKKSAPLRSEGLHGDVDPIDEILNVDEDIQSAYTFPAASSKPQKSPSYSPKLTRKEAASTIESDESPSPTPSRPTTASREHPAIPKLQVSL
jgi:hypothetical protein